MIPELHGTSSPGTKLGDWLKALRPSSKGGAAGYAGKGYSVPSLPENVNAGGIRPGVSNMLSKYMPGELVSHMTGRVEFAGWTSVVVLILIFGGVQLLSLGIVSEYVGRTYEEVKRRPRYVIESLTGIE